MLLQQVILVELENWLYKSIAGGLGYPRAKGMFENFDPSSRYRIRAFYTLQLASRLSAIGPMRLAIGYIKHITGTASIARVQDVSTLEETISCEPQCKLPT